MITLISSLIIIHVSNTSRLYSILNGDIPGVTHLNMFCRLAVDCIRSSILPGEQLMVYCSRKRQIRMHTSTAQVARSLVYFKACEQIVIPLKELKVPKSIATERKRHLTTGNHAERTERDFRCPICRSTTGQSSCLICERRRQLTFPFCCKIRPLFIRRTTTILNSLSTWSIRAFITDT